jgi:hypothetical protein
VAQPSDEQIVGAMVNLCRCGTYNAIKAAMHELSGGTGAPAAAAAPPRPPHRPLPMASTRLPWPLPPWSASGLSPPSSGARPEGPGRQGASMNQPHDLPLQVSPDGAPVNVSRRRFLLASAGTAAGALVVGFACRPAMPGPRPMPRRQRPVRAYRPSEIRPDNSIHLQSPFVEGGQGIFTAMAQIVGEELDADPARFVVHNAPANDQYR